MSKTVIIAEPNKLFSEVLAGTFSLLGFQVTENTANGGDALTLAQKTGPDLLVMDFSLLEGGLRGLSELTRLKESFPRMKILLMGAHEVLDGFLEQIATAGADGYWNKFDDRQALLNVLKPHFP